MLFLHSFNRGICATNVEVFQKIKVLLPQLAEAYKAVFGANQQKREFFGLRDFYRYVVCSLSKYTL